MEYEEEPSILNIIIKIINEINNFYQKVEKILTKKDKNIELKIG